MLVVSSFAVVLLKPEITAPNCLEYGRLSLLVCRGMNVVTRDSVFLSIALPGCFRPAQMNSISMEL